ncbi:MAG: glycosyltransferase [Aggregatilineales bacterium]
MQIGLITGEYPPMQGGVGAYTQVLARTFARSGHVVFLLAPPAAEETCENIVVDAAPTWSLKIFSIVDRWAAARKPDIINIQYQTAAFSMSPWIHFLPTCSRHAPVVTTFHDLRFPYLFPKAGPLRPWIVRYLARTSDGMIVTNHEDALQFRSLSHCALIPIGSNILASLPAGHRRDAWREQHAVPHDAFVIAFFGLINRSKGLISLLHALHQLTQEDESIRLLMIGGVPGSSDPENRSHQEEIKALIRQLDLERRIIDLGFVDDVEVAASLDAADVVALPFLDGASYRRGSLMAALHYGAAIVTTRPAVPIAAFQDGVNMLLVPPGEASAFAAALGRLRNDVELRHRLKAGARALAGQFSWDAIATQTLDFFERIRNKRR